MAQRLAFIAVLTVLWLIYPYGLLPFLVAARLHSTLAPLRLSHTA
jgi:hypothetical protein